MDTQNDGLEKVGPVKHSHFGIYVRFLGCISKLKIPVPKTTWHSSCILVVMAPFMNEPCRLSGVDSVDSPSSLTEPEINHSGVHRM